MIKRTFSFINLKGGVGKTTIATTTAYILSQMCGLKVLLIDNDKQGNTTQFFNAEREDKYTIADILLNGNLDEDTVICKTKYNNLDVIGADMGLAAANLKLIKDNETHQQQHMLSKFIGNLKTNYDFCIIDNAPDVNASVYNALVITNEVIVITTPDEYGTSGVQKMQEQIDLARRDNPTLQFRGVLLNKFFKTHNSYIIKAKLRKNYPVFETNVRFTQNRLDDAITKKESIIELSPNCGFSQDMKRFVKELLYIK